MQKVQKQSINLINNLEKIVVNVGIGRFSAQPNFKEKILPELIKDVKQITGQHPAFCLAKISVAGFKLREGTVVGLKVTLRGKRMEDFFNRLNKIVLPRIRDFRGISLQSMDSNGNLTIGLKEHTAFPEIIPELSKFDIGLEISFVSKETNKEKAMDFYKKAGIPFKRK